VHSLSSVPSSRYLSQYCDLSPIPSNQHNVQHSIRATSGKNANRHRISAKKNHGMNHAIAKPCAQKAAQSSMEDTLPTHHNEKRNANNLVGHERNNVINKLAICLSFVIFKKPAHNKFS
jgi:hypothetical protein